MKATITLVRDGETLDSVVTTTEKINRMAKALRRRKPVWKRRGRVFIDALAVEVALACGTLSDADRKTVEVFLPGAIADMEQRIQPLSSPGGVQ